LIDKFHIRLMDKRDIPGASEIDIVPADHPYLRIISMRKADRTTPVWPLGFAALDACDHPNPRVARAAKEVWNQWIANLVDPQSGSGHG